MKKRLLALAVLLGLGAALCAPALAETSKPAIRDNTLEAPDSPAGPDGKDDRANYVPDEVGYLSFENIERRMRKNNLKIEMMQEASAAVGSMDYGALKTQMHATIRGLEMMMDSVDAAYGEADPLAAQLANTYLKSQIQSLESQIFSFDDAEDSAYGTERQMESSQDLLVTAGETMFIAIKAMEVQETALERQLTALNRTVEEMELRYQMGQISALQLTEVKAGRTSLVSGLQTLTMNIRTYKAQLEQFIGAEITGEITLGSVPEVTAEHIAAMNLEEAVKTAKRKNYDVFAAQLAMDKADRAKDSAVGAMKDAAQNQYDSADAQYGDAVQTVELKLFTLHAQVLDKQQILDAAQVSLQAAELKYQAAELKFQQGTLSQNALLTEQEALQSAQETVESAKNDLFAAYNTYCWGADHGILS